VKPGTLRIVPHYDVCAFFVQVTLASCLYDRGLIVTREPLESLSDDGDDGDESCETQSAADSASDA